MTWRNVLKMPPIRNPMADKKPENDNLTMEQYKDLFEDIADPIIERTAKGKDRRTAFVSLDDLGMSPKKAAEVANELYANMGYEKITADKRELKFTMR
tara:strand:+ start:117 stop:410 length:294 start_codon:yes stop_codon:yes gene_type:complete